MVSQQTQLCKVIYDRSVKLFIVRNGAEVARCQDKLSAQWAAIEHDNPQVYQVARSLAAEGLSEPQVIRAARVIIEKRVYSWATKGDYVRAVVKAQPGNYSPTTGQDIYHVHRNIVWSCTCQDWVDRRDNGEKGHHCKHTLALTIVVTVAALEKEARETETLALAGMY